MFPCNNYNNIDVQSITYDTQFTDHGVPPRAQCTSIRGSSSTHEQLPGGCGATSSGSTSSCGLVNESDYNSNDTSYYEVGTTTIRGSNATNIQNGGILFCGGPSTINSSNNASSSFPHVSRLILGEDQEGDEVDTSQKFAAPFTLLSCRCSHFDALLPKLLVPSPNPDTKPKWSEQGMLDIYYPSSSTTSSQPSMATQQPTTKNEPKPSTNPMDEEETEDRIKLNHTILLEEEIKAQRNGIFAAKTRKKFRRERAGPSTPFTSTTPYCSPFAAADTAACATLPHLIGPETYTKLKLPPDISYYVESMLHIVRQNRQFYFETISTASQEEEAIQCKWCSTSCNKSSSRDEIPCGCWTADDYIQCLHCGLIGCGPNTILYKPTVLNRKQQHHQHIIQHFITTPGHNFGITCGSRGNLYCFRCGDYVYHELIDQIHFWTKATHTLPFPFSLCDNNNENYHFNTLSKPEQPQNQQYLATQGPFNAQLLPSSFVFHSKEMIFWPGLVVSYNASRSFLFSSVWLDAVRACWTRHQLMSGELDGLLPLLGVSTNRSTRCQKEQKHLAVFQYYSKTTSKDTDVQQRCKIQTPVGLYNLGNTCFMNCVLQCLLHCVPLQRYFLERNLHPHKSCEILRRNNNRHSLSPMTHDFCMACEIDRLFLETYGRCCGIDVLGALLLEGEDNVTNTAYIPYTLGLRSSPPPTNVATIGGSETAATSGPSDVLNTSDYGAITSTAVTPPPMTQPTPSARASIYSSSNSVHDATLVPTMSTTTSTPLETNSSRGWPIIPSRLLTAAWKCGHMNHLAGYEQRDAHEFLQAFLDTLGRHENDFFTRAFEAAGVAKRNPRRGNFTDPCNLNAVQNIFEGSLRNVLICEACGCRRSQYEPFINVSLPIFKNRSNFTTFPITPTSTNCGDLQALQQQQQSCSSSTSSRVTRSARLSLQSCLEQFTTPERLADTVHCYWCNEKTSTLKQHTFSKLPKVLCFHLKRFDARNNKKINDPVTFPIDGLNMGPFLPQWREMSTYTEEGANPKKSEFSVEAPSPQILYDLFGTNNHTGTLNQGHYIANVKVGNRWYQCNDSFISCLGEHIEESDVTNSAYMLFYIRRDDKTDSETT